MFPSANGKTPISYGNLYKRRIPPARRKIGLAGVNFPLGHLVGAAGLEPATLSLEG